MWNFEWNLWLSKLSGHRTGFDVDRSSRLFEIRFIICKGKTTGWTPGRTLSFLTPFFVRQILVLIGVVPWAIDLSWARLFYYPFGNVGLSDWCSSRKMSRGWPSWERPYPHSWSPRLLRFNDLLIFGQYVLHWELHRGAAQTLALRPHSALHHFGLASCLLSVFRRRFLSLLL